MNRRTPLGRRGARWTVLPLLIAAATLALPTGTAAQGARVGAWVDSIVVVVEPSIAAAVSRLEANDIQAYFAATMDPAQRDRIARNPRLAADPARWTIVTGGRASRFAPVISRDQAGVFNFLYTPRVRPEPLWQASRPGPEFDRVADRLARRDFATVSERNRLMAQALELSMRDSVVIFLVDAVPVWPRRAELKITSDLAGGTAASQLWPYTIRYEGRAGGTVRIGIPNVLVAPWNPLSGSTALFDMTFIRATQDPAVLPDPHTGLFWPQRIERAEVTVQRGLPVSRTHDWVSLRAVPEIRVPTDAFISWDPRTQRFITVGERHPGGITARTRTVVHFERDLFRNAQWHDGTALSLGDIMLRWILTFDRAMEGSAIFDPAVVPAFRTFEHDFRGFRITSESPLVAGGAGGQDRGTPAVPPVQ